MVGRFCNKHVACGTDILAHDLDKHFESNSMAGILCYLILFIVLAQRGSEVVAR